MPDPKRDLLRHTVATIAYRGSRALRGTPESFADFRATESNRTPAEILAHMGDLFDWCLSIAQGKQAWHNSTPLAWIQEQERFFTSLEAFDAYLASESPLGAPAEKLLQGGVADALTHIGQIAMLRRIAGCPMRGENYYVASIHAGRVGAEQAAAVREFD
ncbi:MAG: hypothetical protein LAO79_21650 [Acidobacteriia bacterium]|nr:hypothetical protein [Terriglobia bacterium]